VSSEEKPVLWSAVTSIPLLFVLCVFLLGRVACRAFPEEATSVTTIQTRILSSEGRSLWIAVYFNYI
jgi:hypothetical protein